ncbi:gas vesicle protein GvpL [Methanosarcina sp. Mfa9]|uniref:gas vesicle protein GvpL n=1 Tax=Methanosarcina sp. Mfa9 TaxID=3439063 RepID=UPI003F82FBDD
MSENDEGRYLYSILDRGIEASFTQPGVNNGRVYTVVHEGIAAVVHACNEKIGPAASEEEGRKWLLQHIRIVDMITEKFGTVIPFTFGTILKGDDKSVQEWLAKNYADLNVEFCRFEGKAEYLVQIFYEQEVFSGEALQASPGLQKLSDKISSLPRGTAYLFEKQLEQRIKEEIEVRVSGLAAEFEAGIRKYADEVRADEKKPKVPDEYKGKKMFVALSCLVSDSRVRELGELLDRINSCKGLCVRFIGPWPPFSFVGLQGI